MLQWTRIGALSKNAASNKEESTMRRKQLFAVLMAGSMAASLAACVIPFIFTDLLKCFIATFIGLKLKENISIKSVLN